MEFGWTEEQRRYRDQVIAFATEDLVGDVAQRDADAVFPSDHWKRCAAFGIQGLPVPVEYGGRGGDPLTIAVALEALGYGCRDNGLLFAIGAQMWSAEMPILRFGTEAQRGRYLPGLCNGDLIGVQGMTEPEAGSDAMGLSTRAQAIPDGYRLDGAKTFVTNAPVADVFVVFATLDPDKGWAGVSGFVVDRATPGFSVGQPFAKMGVRTALMSELVLSNCEVPATAMLGKPGGGLAVFNHSMEWERSFILATAIGTMQRQLERCISYARTRRQFGQPIGKFQAVGHRIVDMKLRLKSARLALYHLAWLKGEGKPTAVESAEVKLTISEAFLASSLDALQIHGGSGYLTEHELERDVRDAIAGRIYSGTSDIQRNIIASRLGL